MGSWSLQEVRVQVPRVAEIPYGYRPAGKYASFVQEVLCQIKKGDWHDRRAVYTMELGYPFLALTTPVRNGLRIWARHKDHSARQPDLSPFVTVAMVPCTTRLTVVLAGTPEKPVVVRVFPGEYRPPLPWQRSLRNAERAESLAFWQRNAYVFYPSLFVPQTKTLEPPGWFMGS